MIHISVIIATYNRGGRLLRTLRSLAAQTMPAGEWEAIVVNNNSTDDTADVFARFASGEGRPLDIRMVDEPRQGLSWARNRGLDEARGAIIVMIDDDEEINPGFLRAYSDFFASHPAALAAGGPMVACYEESRPRWMSHYTEALAASTIDLGRKVRRFPRGRYPIGGNMAFRREVFSRFGTFDPALGRTGGVLLGGEEKELFARIAAGSGSGFDDSGGGIWWVPGAVVNHLIPASRVTDAHFRRLSRMVGVTARILSRSRGGYLGALMGEAIKWCATLVIALWFTLTLRPSKSRYLLIMRRQITSGLLSSE
ncbi:MAG: glycosyltransferase [Alistipes sp.]|jgi:glycosyltransferase involved in cell wall biosynthesis|nr:glycosyltransferase [Alistipes sp.]